MSPLDKSVTGSVMAEGDSQSVSWRIVDTPSKRPGSLTLVEVIGLTFGGLDGKLSRGVRRLPRIHAEGLAPALKLIQVAASDP